MTRSTRHALLLVTSTTLALGCAMPEEHADESLATSDAPLTAVADAVAVADPVPAPVPADPIYEAPWSCGLLDLQEGATIDVSTLGIAACSTSDARCWADYHGPLLGKMASGPSMAGTARQGFWESDLDASSRATVIYSNLYDGLVRDFGDRCRALGGRPCQDEIFSRPPEFSGSAWGGNREATKWGIPTWAPSSYTGGRRNSALWGCKVAPAPPPPPPPVLGGACTVNGQAGAWWRARGRTLLCCPNGTYLDVGRDPNTCVANADASAPMQAGGYSLCMDQCERLYDSGSPFPIPALTACFGVCGAALVSMFGRMVAQPFCSGLLSYCINLRQTDIPGTAGHSCMTNLYYPLCVWAN